MIHQWVSTPLQLFEACYCTWCASTSLRLEPPPSEAPEARTSDFQREKSVSGRRLGKTSPQSVDLPNHNGHPVWFTSLGTPTPLFLPLMAPAAS
jgi:hypothetical protein